jgi:preprotein translocase subunit SecA
VGDDETLLTLVADKRKAVGEDAFFETFRRIVLHVTDLLWVEHLETMEYSRSSVNLRAYGGREPLVEYQREGLRLFRDMENAFRSQTVDFIHTISGVTAQTLTPEPATPAIPYVATHQEPEELTGKREIGSPIPPKETSSERKVGRNDPCPCGSGKKFKKCHGM